MLRFACALIIILTIPTIAAASDLKTTNSTLHEYATFQFANGFCGGKLNGDYFIIEPMQTHMISEQLFRLTCGSDSCKAIIIMSTSKAEAKNCQGKRAGYVKVVIPPLSIESASGTNGYGVERINEDAEEFPASYFRTLRITSS